MSAKSADVDAEAYARVGQILRGKYCLEGVLGFGGMSVVYAATHRNKARFAIKILGAELSARDEVRTRFLREGYAANSVRHRAIVHVLDDDTTEDGAAFLVMELLEGVGVEPLWERYERRMPVPVALAIVEQALEGLAAAHACGVVHRDVKPANLFVTAGGTVKVLDFGIARVREAAQTGGNAATGDGVLLGTPAFMAPEQAVGRMSAIDPRTDLWSVGATLFTLLAGRYVHDARSLNELLMRAATFQAPSLRDVLPRAPAVLVELVDRALAFHPDARWPDAATMRVEVRRAYRQVFGQLIAPAALLHAVVTDRPSDGPSSQDEHTLRDELPPEAVPPSGRVRTEPIHAAPRNPWGTLPMAGRPLRPAVAPALPAATAGTTAPPVSTDPFAPRIPTSMPPPRMPRAWKVAIGSMAPLAAVAVLIAAARLGASHEGQTAGASLTAAAAGASLGPSAPEPLPEPDPLATTPPAVHPDASAGDSGAP